MRSQQELALLPLYAITVWALTLCAAAIWCDVRRKTKTKPIRNWRAKRRTQATTKEIWDRHPESRPRGQDPDA
ncbi:hypothetical protein A8924_2294 [Saccharopolyspora erythraea NRRL 2338]|uniref:Secreted protein n=2 Tax=Saccharopolyspora erythraea TaxID=1836 RepID=A0ABP3MGY6_SACER|nr:hypothetical protein [Saccharopolyspora erythraea]PFG94989.1 hypothetical protein A8924_2294 [Saccharopolyspora erythraea NRRL 2338]QRK91679.1 hypothetical protein JQX30_10025 [Saccharopolyspora erythraea]